MTSVLWKFSWLHTTAYLKEIRHFARGLKKVLTEVWKDKNTKEHSQEIKEHEISNTLHRGLSVVPKADG